MPWTHTDPMLQRAALLADFQAGLYSNTELARRYGVSRKTVHKWISRWQSGERSTEDRSRAPASCPHAHGQTVRDALMALRRKHPTWGPRKLVLALAREQPKLPRVGHATAARWFADAGLTRPRRRRRTTAPAPVSAALTQPERAGHVWTVDFKGQARLGSGAYVYPLTLCDAYSRFVLSVTAHASTGTEEVQPAMQRAFERYGLPVVLRSDNGTPFASPPSPLRLTRLSAWWIRLGISPERTAPRSPQQNGRHERMHRDLKAETMRPCAGGFSQQQACFDAWRTRYNEVRPHEGLGQRTPSHVHAEAQVRAMPPFISPPEYEPRLDVRSVRRDGTVKLRGRYVFVSTALVGERVGLEEVAEAVWSVQYYHVELGRMNLAEP